MTMSEQARSALLARIGEIRAQRAVRRQVQRPQ